MRGAEAATYSEIDLSSYVDLNLVPAAGGPYPVLGTIGIAGVPFATLASTDSNGTPALAAIGGQQFDDKATIATDIASPTAVYTLINSSWGQQGFNSGQVVLGFSGGGSYTYDLVEGVNVRDHYNGNYVNTTSSPDVIGTYNSTSTERLDAQEILIPGAYRGDTLTSITFETYGYGPPLGSPFLAAATVSSGTPEPATWAIMLLGFGGLGAAMRARRTPRTA